MAIKRFTAAERKKQIALVAAELFAKKGFNGVTTREIARTAQVNEAILFRYFPTKNDLYTEIINQKVHLSQSDFNLDAVKKGDDREVFCSIARYLMKQIEDDNTFLRLMLYSALEGHNLSILFLKNRTNVLFDFISGYISKRAKDKVFRKVNPVIATRMFIGAFFHFIMTRELFKLPKQLLLSNEEAVKGFVDIYLNGVMRR